MGTECVHHSHVDTASGTRKGKTTMASISVANIVPFRTNVIITGLVWIQFCTEMCLL